MRCVVSFDQATSVLQHDCFLGTDAPKTPGKTDEADVCFGDYIDAIQITNYNIT